MWIEHRGGFPALDVDAYGALIDRMSRSGRTLGALFRDPPIWKGPIIPFLFGAAYFLVPFRWAPLALNAVAFAGASACFYLVFRKLGAPRLSAVVAVMLWILYLPERYVFAYYYAEPALSLIVALTSLVFVNLIAAPVARRALLLGVCVAVLLLARPPFLFCIAGLTLLMWSRVGAGRRRLYGTLLLSGAVLVYSPWLIRNAVVYHAFIPFTTEGGKIMFQGVWLPGDDAIMNDLRAMPEWRAIEQQEGPFGLVERYRFWQRLSLEAIKADPVGELRLCVRKAIRFWVYMPQFSWHFAWKTGLLAAVAVPFAILGFLRNRRSLTGMLAGVWVGGLWLFHAVVHSELRYNFPILPWFFLLSLMGARSVLHTFRRIPDQPPSTRF